MKKETGFDPEFFEENINASFTGVCRAITSIDCPAIFHWSHSAQHERWAHLISEISGDITLLSKIAKTPLQQTTFDEMQKITTEPSQRTVFKNIFVKSLERSCVYSEKIRSTRVEVNGDSYWTLSAYAVNVDSLGGVPEYLDEQNFSDFTTAVQSIADSYLQEFTMAYKLDGNTGVWNDENFKLWDYKLSNPENTYNTSILKAGELCRFSLQPSKNVFYDDDE
ncbi:Oidioi.mRNA.OKI2018_I69.PAR.g9378.t1.cds [Oikopleura dioica]|uniref:Oidioi.mRNA.OKI2018_I69.PAR.g9378.t1.cds n=1 Tax=Oikopleura dioica TaxID=34765 RepID=A0ABN7RK81_OIKDI|nr:Oidioi.mRNA.OKI2018_I69.PAR.g9378.t1.cds [Oikopleura dioica]